MSCRVSRVVCLPLVVKFKYCQGSSWLPIKVGVEVEVKAKVEAKAKAKVKRKQRKAKQFKSRPANGARHFRHALQVDDHAARI